MVLRWMASWQKPNDFDASKIYPVFFFVYGEPASAVATDEPNFNDLIADLIPRGYIGIAMDNRGTPVMKGTTMENVYLQKNWHHQQSRSGNGCERNFEMEFY